MIARVAEGDKADVDLAVEAAREAFDHGKWPRMSGFVSSLSFLEVPVHSLSIHHRQRLHMLASIAPC